MAVAIQQVRFEMDGVLVECELSRNGKWWDVVGVVDELTTGQKAQAKNLLAVIMASTESVGPHPHERQKAGR